MSSLVIDKKYQPKNGSERTGRTESNDEKDGVPKDILSRLVKSKPDDRPKLQ